MKSPNQNATSNGTVIENESEDQAKLRQFLEDAIEARDEMASRPTIEEESENEEDLDQPKILGYQDELDEEDRIEGQPTALILEAAESSPKNGELVDRLNSSEALGDELKESDGLKENAGDQRDEPKDADHALSDTERLADKKKVNGHNDKEAGKESRKKSKENKISINLVDSLPDKSILESHSSKSKKNKKSKRSSKDGAERLSRKKSQNIEELLGPYVSPIDEGPTGNEDEYFALWESRDWSSGSKVKGDEHHFEVKKAFIQLQSHDCGNTQVATVTHTCYTFVCTQASRRSPYFLATNSR